MATAAAPPMYSNIIDMSDEGFIATNWLAHIDDGGAGENLAEIRRCSWL